MEKGRRLVIHTKYAVAVVVVDDESGEVVDAAPIYHWMMGKKWDEIKGWKKIRKVVEL